MLEKKNAKIKRKMLIGVKKLTDFEEGGWGRGRRSGGYYGGEGVGSGGGD